MTQEQYDRYLQQKKEIEEEYEEQKKEEEDEQEEEMVLKPGENFKQFDVPADEEVKQHKVEFKIADADKDPDMQDLKAKMLLMMEQESSEEEEDDFLENLNKDGAKGQEKLTRAEREVAEAHNEKAAAKIKADLDRLAEVKKRRELAAKRREEEKKKKEEEMRKKQEMLEKWPYKIKLTHSYNVVQAATYDTDESLIEVTFPL